MCEEVDWRGSTATVTRIDENTVKKQLKPHTCTLYSKEVNGLSRVRHSTHPAHFPALISSTYDKQGSTFVLSFCGDRISKENCPANYFDQVLQICTALSDTGIWFADITKHNTLVHNGVVKIIDFGDCHVYDQHIYPLEEIHENLRKGRKYSCNFIHTSGNDTKIEVEGSYYTVPTHTIQIGGKQCRVCYHFDYFHRVYREIHA